MKKNLKAIVSIILVLGLLVCLTGCGENEKKQEAIDEFNTTAAAFNEVKDLVNANASEIPDDIITDCPEHGGAAEPVSGLSPERRGVQR